MRHNITPFYFENKDKSNRDPISITNALEASRYDSPNFCTIFSKNNKIHTRFNYMFKIKVSNTFNF